MSTKDTFNPFKNEDLWSIWIGFSILLVSLVLFICNTPDDFKYKHETYTETQQNIESKIPFKTIAWYDAQDARSKLKLESTSLGRQLKYLSGKPLGWSDHPLDAFWMNDERVEQKKTKQFRKIFKCEK